MPYPPSNKMADSKCRAQYSKKSDFSLYLITNHVLCFLFELMGFDAEEFLLTLHTLNIY